MAQQVNINVTIAGESVSPIADLHISQPLFDHNVIRLVLPLDALNVGTEVLNQAKAFLNQPISVEITSGIFDLLQRNFTFEGIVTDVRMSRYQRGSKMIYVTAYSPTIHLSGIRNIRSFHEMTLSDIVNQVLQDVPGNMTTQISPKYSEVIEYVVQYKETNMQFLQRLANTYGEWLFYDGDELIFGQLPENEPIDLPLEKDLLDMDLSMRIVPVNHKAKAYDYLKHEIYESTASPADISDVDSFGDEILNQMENQVYPGSSLKMPLQGFPSPNSLDDHIRRQMAAKAREMVILSGITDNIRLRVGSVVNITGERSNEVDLENYLITSVNHQVDQNQSYTNSIQAIPAQAASPPNNPKVRIPFIEAQQATVTDNNDEEGLGRVKVRFKWQEDGQQTPWVRVMQPYAGQQKDELHGFFFTPEIDDEVVVGFYNDNPDLPYIMGSVYRHHDSNHPSEWHDPETKRKVIKTRDGNYIELIDGDKKIRIYNDSGTINEISLDANSKVITVTNAGGNVMSMSGGKTFSITNKDNNNMTMSEGKEITITSKDGKIIVQAKEIEIMADDKLTLDSKEIIINAKQSVKVNSGQEMVMNSDGTAKISAMQSLDIDSMSTTVKGTQQVNVEGAMVNVKGSATTNVEGGAMTQIKGAMLKLN